MSESCRPEELLNRAREMIPALAARADQTQKERNLPAVTVAEMQEAGILRVLRSKRWGGYEKSPRVFLETQRILAQGDMSAGWVYGIYASVAFLMALFDDRASADVWGDDPDTVMCVAQPGRPGNSMRRRLSLHRARWKYASGCLHGRWVVLEGAVAADEPSQAERRLFLVPSEDFKVVDTWKVTGLAGTGRHDVVVEDLFVPAYLPQHGPMPTTCVARGRR